MNGSWRSPCDAQNLAAHCSRYVIRKDEITDEELSNSGNALVVSRARYRGSQCVALKRWHGAVVSEEERILFTKRLMRDLDRWRTLNHPNIAPVLGVALHISNLPALVVPEYRTVNEVLAERPDTDVLHLMQGVAAGLKYLHSRTPPIIHGDLKGSTVFVSPTTGAALLSDIGISAIPQPPDWGFHGVDDARWLAPEVMDPALRPTDGSALSSCETSCNNSEGGGGMDKEPLLRTPDVILPLWPEGDIYSFGMLSYEMHTRARPFSPTVWAAAVIVRVVQGQRPARPSLEQSPQMTDAMWELIEMCWKQAWWERPKINTVVAWLAVLERMRAMGGGSL